MVRVGGLAKLTVTRAAADLRAVGIGTDETRKQESSKGDPSSHVGVSQRWYRASLDSMTSIKSAEVTCSGSTLS